MKKGSSRFVLALSLPLLLAACGQQPVSVQPTTSTGNTSQRIPATMKQATVPNKWFIELEGDPTALGTQSITGQQAAFREQAKAAGIDYQEQYSYHQLFNGFSVVASSQEIDRLAQLPGVKAVYPVRFIPAPEAEHKAAPEANRALQPDMFYAKGMTGATIAQNELGLTGKGVKVGVIDTGLDLTHPAFKGRVVSAVDLVGDDYGKDGKYIAKPGPSPQDCAGHGTHVAGIVGGYDPNNTREGVPFSGVAPEASFGIYRVFGCSGGTNEDVMVAALERAYADGMQVVNLSIGSPFENWSETPSAIVGSRMVKKGMVVVASGGNSGASGAFSMGGVTMGDNVISVAAVDNLKLELDSFKLSDGTRVGYYTATGAPEPENTLSLPVTKRAGSATTTVNDGCTASGGFPEGSLTGKAVLIRRGTCTFSEKAANAQKAGAAAVILYNNAPGYIAPSVSGKPPITIPVVSVSDADGAKIDALIAKGVTVTFGAGKLAINNPTADTTSNFSSYGMSAELEFKPDLGAPGGNILSAYPLALNPSGYEVQSGTSMAAPHVAGAVALLLQANPKLPAKDVRTTLMNTATLRYYRNAAGKLVNAPDYVARQGAGMLNIVNAYANEVHATPPKLSLGDSATFATRTKVVVLKNDSDRDAIYLAEHVPALTLSGTTLAPKPSDEVATMTLNGQSVDGGKTLRVVVPAHGETELNVVITPPAGAQDMSQYGGYISLTSSVVPDLVVPYGGFKGDYRSMPAYGKLIAGKSVFATPILFDEVEDALYARDAVPETMPDYTFKDVEVTDSDGKKTNVFDAPYLWVNLTQQVRRLTVEVLDANGTVVRTIRNDQYLGRSCTNDLSKVSDTCDAYNEYRWNGKLQSNPDGTPGPDAPAGVYQLRVTALRPLGEEGNSAHTEVYVSPKFKVVR